MHLCDLMNPECQKHQTMIHHLLGAVRHNVFEIEVLMLPDCCSESKLSERIQHKEYVLLERWSMTFFESDKAQLSIEIPELLRAVRSFLHFSQISAWLSSTKGKSPANIYYWVKPTSDPSATKFENNPEVHAFPPFKVNDELCGTVRVNFPTRKQYIPIIPCSKHPPHPGLRLRLTEESSLTPSIALTTQIVKHLQKTCDNQESITSVKHCDNDSNSLKSSSTNINSLTHSLMDINKTNRILKHSNYQIGLKTNGAISSSCNAQICNKTGISLKSDVAIFSNYRQTYSKCSSQENVCFDKLSLSNLLPKDESKINKLNKIVLPLFCETNSLVGEISSQQTDKPIVPKCSSTSNLITSDVCNVFSNVSNLLSTIEPSQSNVSHNPLENASLLEIKKNNLKKSLKRRHILRSEELNIIPNKKCFYKEKCEKIESFNNKRSLFQQNKTLKEPSKRKHSHSLESSKTASNLANHIKVEKCNIEKYGDVWNNSSKSSSKRKAVVEKSQQSLEKCSNERWRYCFNNNESNLESSITYINSELVNFPVQTGNTNQFVNGNLDPANLFSSDCNDVISAKSDCEAFKCLSTKLNLNVLKSSYNAKDALMHKNCLNANSDINSDIRKSIAFSNNVMGENVSKVCLTNKSSKTSGFQTKNYKIKKRYINNFYKSCRLHKINLYQFSNHEKISSLNDKQSKFLELLKSSNTKRQKFSYLNVSCTRASKLLLWDKKEKKESLARNICESSTKSSSLDLIQVKKTEEENQEKRRNLQNKSANSFAQNPIFAENHNSEIIISNSDLLRKKSSKDSSLYLISCEGDKSEPSLFKSKNLVHDFQDSNKNLVTFQRLDTSPNLGKKSVFSCNSSWNVLPQKATMYHDCFPRHELKFARGRKLLGNFEESILKGCLLPVSNVEGFHTEIGASGSFCPNHITLPADVSFYAMDNLHSPYMANVKFHDVEYYVPKKGAIQVTLFNPSETVVKMFVLNYDLSDMPPSCHTFIRQKTYFMPIGSAEDCPSSSKWLRFILHLRFASSKAGKLYLHKDLKIVVLNKSNDDAASEFNQEPRELRSFLHVPMNPTFSNY
ncbi:atos homolog protein A isoform X2 [Parasteatoda tepidariorum]|nr:protein FAM214A isoform X2 [Parasteatoda tepidariorum]